MRKNRMKSLLSCLLAVFILLSFVAPTLLAEDKEEITIALSNEPDGIDPSVTSNSFASPFLTNCFEGLVTYDENNELIPALAESWEISDDLKTYTFKLRDDLKWSDGTDLTANDFVYSMKRVLTPETTAQYLNMLTDYIVGAEAYYDGEGSEEDLGVKALDDQTLEITLMDPALHYLNILAMPVYAPVQEATIEANGDKWTLSPETYVTNGPFYVSEMNMGESVVLEKNENYYAADEVKLDKITFRYIKEATTALTAFERGEIDAQRSVPIGDFSRLRSESTELHILPQYATTYYIINCGVEPYNDPLVRKALNLAIDRRDLAENLLQGSAQPAMTLVAPGYVVDGEDFLDSAGELAIPEEADPEGAREALAEAGYPDGEGFPTLQLSYYTDAQVKPIAEAIAQMLQENLNINVEITNEEWAVYYDGIQAGNFEVAAMGWGADYLNPMTFLPLFVSDDIMNNSDYANPDYDAAVEEAKRATDEKDAMAKMRAAENILLDDFPFIPLYFRTTQVMVKDYLKGWYLTPTNNWYFRSAYIER